MADIDIFNMSKADLIDFYSSIKRGQHADWWQSDEFVRNNVIWLDRVDPNANFKFKYIRCTSDSGDTVQTEVVNIGVKLSAPDATRACFVKVPLTVRIPDNIGGYRAVNTESLILVHGANVAQGVTLNGFPTGTCVSITAINRAGSVSHGEYSTTIRDSLKTQWINTSGTTISDWIYWKMSGDGTGGITHRYWTNSQKNNIATKFSQICGGITYGLSGNLAVMTDYPYWESQYSSFFNGYAMGRYETDYIMTYDELPFPLFDYNQTADIIKYINTGDKSGAIDPFDFTPEKTEVEDLTNTSYRIFVSPDTNDKKKTHFSIIAYNPEYIEYGETVAGEYGMHVSLDYMRTQTGSVESFNIGNFAQSKYPTLGYIMSDVGYSSVFNLSFRNLNDNAQPIRVYSIGFEADKTKESHCQLVGANYGGQVLSKHHIVDGYRFEHGSNWIEVLFRAVDISDLNDGYPDPDDTDDDKSGTDSDYSGASGLRTFVINNTDFDTINSKLWSTDWSTVFKSNSIDPIRCVIACKGIPFTADNVSSAEVMIANLDTGLSKNYVKTVKSFTANSVLMPSFSGDFTDITLTHIRCYLPYIGWVELPASECVSRVAYTSVGIEARPKRLKFKYLVDFVDGNVRCIVSVNDTERWFFDGNCAIDIPVTSDNHTQAISNAIRSGVQTGLSIVTAIGGAVAKNAGAVAGGVMGAMQSAPNIFPTYSFTATSNGSGYINASMNQHIMLVIEHPNVIRSADYAKRVGIPCGLSLNLGSLHGYTRCVDVNVTGIDATPNEIQRIKSLLESGVYL